jgi:hypothetical protein
MKFPHFTYKTNVPFKTNCFDEPVSVIIGQYTLNDRVAIELEDADGQLFAKATVNLAHSHVEVNEVFIKAHDENAGIVGFLIENEVIVADDSPPLFKSGFSTYPKFRLHPKLAGEIASRCV